ncbi:MAG: sugar phosphate isomerase/epimerase family protein [Planctomycetota bacterium]
MSTRRRFLQGMGGAAAAALFSGSTPLASGRPRRSKPMQPPFKISLAQWSLHRQLGSGELDNLDFAKVAKEKFGIEAVEYVNSFFKAYAGDFEYLGRMKARAEEVGVKSLLIMIDGEGLLADADPDRRRQAVENHFKWIAAAKFLGCHSIRVNAGGSGEPEEQAERAAESLVRLARVAEPYDLNVIVENHGGLSSNGAWLSGVMKRVNNPRVGTLPDFGNFNLGQGEQYDRYLGVSEMMPFAKAVSAKSHDFDEHGNETGTDFEKMMRIVLDAGYHGHVGIEYEGSSLPEEAGIQKTKDLLLRILRQESP